MYRGMYINGGERERGDYIFIHAEKVQRSQMTK